jgi:hypothetical protein
LVLVSTSCSGGTRASARAPGVRWRTRRGVAALTVTGSLPWRTRRQLEAVKRLSGPTSDSPFEALLRQVRGSCQQCTPTHAHARSTLDAAGAQLSRTGACQWPSTHGIPLRCAAACAGAGVHAQRVFRGQHPALLGEGWDLAVSCAAAAGGRARPQRQPEEVRCSLGSGGWLLRQQQHGPGTSR